jgi:CBS domain-containing protein
MGGALGGIEANFFPHQATGFWVLVGMGAILGGTMRSPLTGIVFALELTHDVNMLLPLTIAVTIAHAFTVLTLRRSILTEKVARRGFHVSREYAIDELEILFVRDVMETKITSLPCHMTPTEALATIEPRGDDRRQWVYPVLDDDARLLGAATYNQLSKWAAAPDKVGKPLQELIDGRAPTVLTSETLRAAVHQMSETNVTRLLAVNPADPNRLVGMIALHDMLKARARHIEDETRRERILPWDFIVPAWVKRVVPGYPGQE